MIKFLETPVQSLAGKSLTIICALSFSIVWITLVNMLFSYFYGQPSFSPPENWLYYLLFSCTVAPLWEEFAFRVFPTLLSKAINPKLIIPTLIFSSVVFGLGHGNGMVSLLKQGTLGLIFSAVYLKNNYSYTSAVITHSIWNILCSLHPM